MLLNLFFKIIQIFSLETKTFSSIRDDFLIINVFQKQKKPQNLLLLLQRLSKTIRILFLSFTSVIIQDLQRWNEDTQRILRIHGHAEFFFIFVSLFCLLQKKIYMWARKGLPISLMTIILHRTKAVISSITPLYIVKREIKYKKNHPVHRMIYPKQ